MEIKSKSLDRLIFKLKLSKKTSEVANISTITCSMTSAYLGKMCVKFHFWKCNENTDFLLKNTHEKEKDLFFFEKGYFLLCLLILSLFLSDIVFLFQIMPWIKYTTTNRTYHPVTFIYIYIYIYNTLPFFHLVCCRNITLVDLNKWTFYVK